MCTRQNQEALFQKFLVEKRKRRSGDSNASRYDTAREITNLDDVELSEVETSDSLLSLTED